LKSYFAILTVIMFTLSGVLTVCREYISGGQYQTYTDDDIKIAQYIKENTPGDAIFLTQTNHINPVVSLAGRSVYVGSSLYVYFHGFTDEYEKRSEEVNGIFNSSSDELFEFCKENNISYVYVGRYEKENINYNILEDLECVVNIGDNSLYKVQ
ncbi:MAG: hypothetical protein IKV64_04625, partial [Clostridia bacterium]|nr:hypothetical protein [Clostridia bacterium]